MAVTPGPRHRRAGLGGLAGLVAALLTAALLQPQAAAQPSQQTPGEAYAARGFGVFMHYGLATFVGQTPWNYDPHDVEPTEYNPTDFDPDQWMRANQGIWGGVHHPDHQAPRRLRDVAKRAHRLRRGE